MEDNNIESYIIIIKAKLWFDKINGNTYHSVKVFINTELIGENLFAYGYGEQHLFTAFKILQKKGYYTETGKISKSGMDEEYYIFKTDMQNNRNKFLIFVDKATRKKDLK